MTDEEALEILKKTDRIGVNLILTNTEETTQYNLDSAGALFTAIKALEVIKKIKKAYAEYSPHKFAVAESIGAILCEAYGADEVNASGFAGYKQCCDNCGTGLEYCELDNRDRFRFCGNWTPKGVVG